MPILVVVARVHTVRSSCWKHMDIVTVTGLFETSYLNPLSEKSARGRNKDFT